MRAKLLTVRRAEVTWLALLVAVTLFLFAGVLLFGEGFYVRDVIRDYLPARAILNSIVRGGEFPLWNRFLSAGQPLAANPGFQTFYPGTWLILLAGFPLGFHLEIVLHIALAAVGMFLLLRSLTLSTTASFFGACSFAFGGTVLSLTNLLPFLTSIAWWPLIVLFARSTLRAGQRRHAAALALCLGMLFLAAEQSMLIQTAILLLSVALSERSTLRNGWRPGLIACLMGLAIGAVQIVPALDLARDSSRGRGVTFDDAMSWSMPLVRPLELVDPHAFGRITDDGSQYRGAWRYQPPRVPLISSLYCGMLVPLLVMAGMLRRVRLWKWTLALVTVSYALTVGSHGPVLPLLYRAGLFRGIRYPEKFILLGLFACVVFAAIVFDRLREPELRRRVVILASIVAAAALIGRWTIAATSWTDALAVMVLSVAIVAVILLLPRRPFAIPLLLVIAAADLGMHVRELAPTMPARFFTAPPVVASLTPARGPYRLFHAASWPVWGDRAIQLRGGAETYWSQRETLPPFTSAMYGLRSAIDLDINLTHLAPAADFVESFWEITSHRVPFDTLLPMANVSTVLMPSGNALQVLAVRSTPRYAFASGLQRVTSRQDFVRQLASGRFPMRTAFVAREPFVPAPGLVRTVDERTNQATIDVEAAGKSFLMISVTPHRYWSATIDGAAVPLEIVNVGFQGLVVPAGHHVIRMAYRNRLLEVCAAISLIALVLACAALFLGRTRERGSFQTSPEGSSTAPSPAGRGSAKRG